MKNQELLSPDAADSAGGSPEAEPMSLEEVRKEERMILRRLPKRLRTNGDFDILKDVVEELDGLQTVKLQLAEKTIDPVQKEALEEQVTLWDEAYLTGTTSLSALWPVDDEEMKPSAGKVSGCNNAVLRIRHILTGKTLPELEAETSQKPAYTKVNRDGSISSLKGTEVAANIKQKVSTLEYQKDKLLPLNHIVNVRRFMNELPKGDVESDQLRKDVVKFLSADGVVPSDLANVEGGFVRWPYRFNVVLNEEMLRAELKNIPKIGVQIEAADEKKKTAEVRKTREDLEKIVTEAFARLRAEKESTGSISAETMREVFKTIPLHRPFFDACERSFRNAELWPGKRYSRKAEAGEKPVMAEFEEATKQADAKKAEEAAAAAPKATERATVIEAADWKGTVENFNTELRRLMPEFEKAMAAAQKEEIAATLETMRAIASQAKIEAEAYGDVGLRTKFTEMEMYVNNVLASFALMSNGLREDWKTNTLFYIKKYFAPQTPTVSGDRISRGPMREGIPPETAEMLERLNRDLETHRDEFESVVKGTHPEEALDYLDAFIDVCTQLKDLAASVKHPDIGLYESRVQQVQWLSEQLKQAQAGADIPLDRVLQFLDHIIGRQTMGVVRTPTTMEDYFKGATDSPQDFLDRLASMETDKLFESISRSERQRVIGKAMEFFTEAFERWNSVEFQSQSATARREAIEADLQGVMPPLRPVALRLCEREFLQPTQAVVKAPARLTVVEHRRSAVVRRAPRELVHENVKEERETPEAPKAAAPAKPLPTADEIIAAYKASKERASLPPVPAAAGSKPSAEQSRKPTADEVIAAYKASKEKAASAAPEKSAAGAEKPKSEKPKTDDEIIAAFRAKQKK